MSSPQRWPPRPWVKGVGAEAGAVACILAGIAENIRTAVAVYAKGYHPYTLAVAFGEDSCFAAIFFILTFIFCGGNAN